MTLSHDERMHRRGVREQLGVALRHGEVLKPTQCSVCHETTRVVGHHDDYNRPLDVRWLCFPCHSVHHSRILELAAGII